MVVKACKLEGCDRPVKTKGYCDVHYRRTLKYGDPGSPEIRSKIRKYNGEQCSVAGCDLLANRNMVCTGHYQRLHHHGEYGSNPIRITRKPDPDRLQRDRMLWSNYRLTIEQFDAMLEAQDYKCPICSEATDDWHVDHDHGCCKARRSCGQCVRGILCARCNIRLGFIEAYLADPESVDSYLVGVK